MKNLKSKTEAVGGVKEGRVNEYLIDKVREEIGVSGHNEKSRYKVKKKFMDLKER